MNIDLEKIPAEIRDEFELLTANTVEVLPADEFAQKLLC